MTLQENVHIIMLESVSKLKPKWVARTGILRKHAQSQIVNKRCAQTDIPKCSHMGKQAHSHQDVVTNMTRK